MSLPNPHLLPDGRDGVPPVPVPPLHVEVHPVYQGVDAAVQHGCQVQDVSNKPGHLSKERGKDYLGNS